MHMRRLVIVKVPFLFTVLSSNLWRLLVATSSAFWPRHTLHWYIASNIHALELVIIEMRTQEPCNKRTAIC